MTTDEQVQFVRQWAWVPVLVGVLAAVVWGALSGWLTIPPTTDIDQQWLNTAVPPPHPDQPLSQTFVSRHNGLSQFETLIVHYGPDNESNTAIASLTLKDANGRILATRRLTNNQTDWSVLKKETES